MDKRTLLFLVSTTEKSRPLTYLVTACLVVYGRCGPPHSVANVVRREPTVVA